MRYLSVTEIAIKWNISERSVINYCSQGRVNGAFLTGKTWNIPENAEKPERTNKKKEQPKTLLDILKDEKANKYSGGIYHKTQIDLTYNSNHMEGSRLTHEQTRYIFETNTIGVENEVLNVDDIIETANHFRCIDMMQADYVDKLIGIIEAKAEHKDIPSVIHFQGKDYPRNIRQEDAEYQIGTWGEYKVPFTFATNGSGKERGER